MPQTERSRGISVLVQVAQLYYERNLTQEAIAKRLGISRWQVGRLLAEARREGSVRIEVIHTGMSETAVVRGTHGALWAGDCGRTVD